MKKRRKNLPPYALVALGLMVLLGAIYAIAAALKPPAQQPQDSSSPHSETQSSVQSTPAPTAALTTPADEWRAVWISYLEYERMDFSTEAAFTEQLGKMFDNVSAAGLNTVIMQVRPCGDALYPSEIFPWSHFITGTQGQDPGYDPLAVMVQEAHARGLRIEAWVNPYRVRITALKPETIAADNPAALYLADPEKQNWVHMVDGGLWYDPGVPQVRQLIADGVKELCTNYAIDGVQFDDYFYPTTTPEFDADTYAAYGADTELAVWRRGNVDALVALVYSTVKAANPQITFGISPQGNADNNYNQQYSDVAKWLAQPGYADYICPQIYWGFDYRTQSGSDRFAFESCLAEWLGYPRAEGVKLTVGLGAYRIGEGDGSAVESSEWQSGGNLARQVAALRQAGANGYGVYRYDSLWNETQPLCTQETAALTTENDKK